MSLWAIVQTPIEACFVVFHLSVLVCISVEKSRKNIHLSGAFYTLYFLQSTFDILFVLTVCKSEIMLSEMDHGPKGSGRSDPLAEEGHRQVLAGLGAPQIRSEGRVEARGCNDP